MQIRQTVILIAFLVGVFIAAPKVDGAGALLYLSPSSGSYEVGQSFNAEVRVDTKGATIIGAKAYINFPANLSVASVAAEGSGYALGSLLKNKVVGNQIQIEKIDFSGASGSNLLLATITFKSLSSGAANVAFDSSSKITSGNGSNILGSSQSGAYTINSSASAAASLFLSPSSGTYKKGDTFNAEVRLSTDNKLVIGSKVYLNFSSALGVNNGAADVSGTAFGAVLKNEVVGNQIRLEFVDFSGIKGSNLLVGKISFKALAAGIGSVNFDSSSAVTAENNSNILANTTNGSYNLTEASSTSGAAALFLEPSTTTRKVGDIFNVAIMLNTGGADTDGVDVHYLNFTPSLLEVVRITPGNLYANTDKNTFDNAAGRIDFSQTTSGGNTYKGKGTLAAITFKAKHKGTAELKFDFTPGKTTDCNVSRAGGAHEDILSSAIGGTYNIEEKKVKFKIIPEGKKYISGVKVHIKIYKANETIPVYDFECTLDSLGNCLEPIDFSQLTEGSWVIKVELSYYLPSEVPKTIKWDSKEILVEIPLLSGNFQKADNVINELDWSIMSSKWFTNDAAVDINEDGEVNSLDWHYLNKNWSR